MRNRHQWERPGLSVGPHHAIGALLVAAVIAGIAGSSWADQPTVSPNTIPIPGWEPNVPPPLVSRTPSSPAPSSNSLARIAAEVQTVSAPPSSSAVPEGLNPALLNEREAIAWPAAGTALSPAANEKRKHYGLLLAEARRYRLDGVAKQAETPLASILDSDAPEELKRTALLEMALTAQQENDLGRANQIFAQFVQRYPRDPSVPEVLLRQGLVYRKMGAPNLALSKFYSVMSSAMGLNVENLAYYKRLTLQAKMEIAQTYFDNGRFDEAMEKYNNLLQEEPADLNPAPIHAQLIRSLNILQRYPDVVAQAQAFIDHYSEASEAAEMRFLLAQALKKLGRNRDSRQQVLALLRAKSASATQTPVEWIYWQQRTGNEIANQLYREGDYLNALDIYLNLAELDVSAAWQLPVWYQAGLAYERLSQPRKAAELYARILKRSPELDTNSPPSLRAVLDMAKYRTDFMAWNGKAEEKTRDLKLTAPGAMEH